MYIFFVWDLIHWPFGDFFSIIGASRSRALSLSLLSLSLFLNHRQGGGMLYKCQSYTTQIHLMRVYT